MAIVEAVSSTDVHEVRVDIGGPVGEADLSSEVRALREVVSQQQASIQYLIAGQKRIEAVLGADGGSARVLSRNISGATSGATGRAAERAAMLRSKFKARGSVGSIGSLASSGTNMPALATLPESKRSVSRHHSHHKHHNKLLEITEHPAFEVLSAALILMHSIAVGAYVEYLAVMDAKQHPFIFAANLGLAIIFIGEVAIKIGAERMEYLYSAEWAWNVFDVVLVILLLVEFGLHIMHVHNLAAMVKIGEMIRTGRVLRILKCLRLSSTFQIIFSKIAFSLKSLFWVVVLVFMLLYVVAVCIAQGVVDFFHGVQHAEGFDVYKKYGPDGAALLEHFGSVEKSIYTLFQSITGGQLWGKFATILGGVHEFYVALFITFIALTTLAVLNIVTGIFVDATIMSAKHQRDEMMETERMNTEIQAQQLREVFNEIDQDGDGLVPMEEFATLLQDENVRFFLQSMKIETCDLKRLFKMLDQDGSGEIMVDEFVNGCMHLQGGARNFDVHRLLAGQRRMQRQFDEMAYMMGMTFRGSGRCGFSDQPSVLPEMSVESLINRPGHKVEV